MIRLLILTTSLMTPFSLATANDEAIGAASGVTQAVAGTVVGLNIVKGKEQSMKCTLTTVFPCVVAAASFAQVPIAVATMVSAFKTKKQSSVGTPEGLGDFSLSGGLNDSAPTSIQEQADGFLEEAKDGLAGLEDKGFTVNQDGSITGPNGKTASASSLSSGESLADSGLIPESEINDYDNALKEIKKKKDKIIVKSLGGGAKGGYRGPRKSRRAASSNYNPYASSGLDRSKIRAAQTSGLAKDFGGTPIGVASDDLFNMITERYTALQEERKFIDNAAGTYKGQR